MSGPSHPANEYSIGFSVDYQEAPDAVRLVLSGELDAARADRLSRALRQAEGAEAPLIVLDATGLTFIDSSGLALVLQASRRANAAARRLVVANPRLPVRRIFELAAMEQLLEPS
jgi:anti-anti-sigma factor